MKKREQHRRLAGSWVILALAVFAAGLGCKRHPADELAALESQQSQQETTKSLPPLALTDDTPDLLLTWLDSRGDAHLVNKPADVAPEGRDHVRVVVTTKEDGQKALFYVANLTSKNADGTYPVAIMPRGEWDSIISQRRQAFAAPQAPADPNAADPSAGAKGGAAQARPVSFTVIVYGAAWCGACHEAVAYLKRRKVPVIEKDIEADPAAQSEMQAKLARAGVHGGSIPVIDVKGKILIGFEPNSLEAAVRGASAVTL
jgi:glutaredoxin